ncbi:MAG: DUF4870 domain-containing protein [Syntrophorhabdaceae bacterium]
MEQNNADRSSTGLQQNVAGLLTYLAGFITGIVFIIIEKENRFVRFHAMQSIFVFGFLFVVQIVLSFIPVLRWFLPPIISILGFILWIILMIKAYKGEMYKLPFFGDLAEKQI